MWRFGVLTLVAALCVSEPALAQSARIAGSVRSADGNAPVVAADVEVSGPGYRRVTVTRDDGRYTVPVDPGTYKVKAKRIGFAADSATVTVTAAGETKTVDFTLRATVMQVTGVTVVGYGTQDVRDNTGSVKAVTAEDFNPGRVVSAEQLIQAKVPGVQVIDNNEPGGGISIRIRGGTSVNASNEPLFVVDGVPLNVGGGLSSGRNPLNFLNPADIKEVTVLKDASATAIYGSRGANGVVLITTRSGSALEPAFSYSSNYSSSTVASEPDLLSAAQYRAAVTANAPAAVPTMGAANTNWLDRVLRNAGGAEHNFAVSGVREDMRYRLSLGLLNQDGVLLGTNSRRVAASATYSDLLLRDRLELRANFKGTRNDDQYTPGGVLGNSTAMDPTQAPVTNDVYFQWANPLGPNNPLADLAQVSDAGSTFRSVGNVEAKWFFNDYVDGLSATMRTGYDYATSNRTFFSPSTAQGDLETGRGGQVTNNLPRQVNTVFELFGNFNRKFEEFESVVDVTAGYTYEQQKGDYPSFFAESLTTNLLGPNGVPPAGLVQSFLTVDESKLISFFGRANWTWKDKYLLTASVRRDGSSRFGPDNQWGIFPSFAAAWRMVDEDWFALDAMSDLKLRASWGVNGNQSFGNFLYVPTYETGSTQVSYPFGGQFIATLRPTAVDPNIKWEETTSINLGLDFGFWNDRLTGTLDYYNKDTDDLIFRVPVPAGTTTGNFVTTNIGSMNNKGLELGLSWLALDQGRNGWRYEAGFAISTNSNEITSISQAETDRISVGGIAGGVGSRIQVLQPGSPINSFFVYQHRKGANGRPVNDASPDTAMYVDQNGDDIINQDDLRAFKNPAPRWIIGHTSQATYKAWDFSATARMYLGNHVYNNVASNLGHYSGLTGPVPVNRHASVLKTGFDNPQYFSDYYVEDASFLRLDNLSAAYTFRGLRGVQSVRVFGTIQNVFTNTKYSGVDPLAGVNGIDNNLFPLSRTFTLGANFAF
jgi:TonB-dependent starch-binding outer membrane protein SusC